MNIESRLADIVVIKRDTIEKHQTNATSGAALGCDLISSISSTSSSNSSSSSSSDSRLSAAAALK